MNRSGILGTTFLLAALAVAAGGCGGGGGSDQVELREANIVFYAMPG